MDNLLHHLEKSIELLENYEGTERETHIVKNHLKNLNSAYEEVKFQKELRKDTPHEVVGYLYKRGWFSEDESSRKVYGRFDTFNEAEEKAVEFAENWRDKQGRRYGMYRIVGNVINFYWYHKERDWTEHSFFWRIEDADRSD